MMDSWLNEIHRGDALDLLEQMPDVLAHVCVTSPPYYRLRDYGIPPREWPAVSYRPMPNLPEVAIEPMSCSLGMEPSLEAYVAHMVMVFREVRRVLRRDGTLWLNLGDCIANDDKWGGASGGKNVGSSAGCYPRTKRFTGLRSKDLMGIPWRVAFALQADGWVLRCDNVWNKVNCMPESCKDRPTRCHEYVFLLSQSPRYFYDPHAIREPQTGNAHSRGTGITPKTVSEKRLVKANETFHRSLSRYTEVPGGRNRRSVWNIQLQKFEGLHFATFPAELPRIAILAGTSAAGACPSCGAPYLRVTRRQTFEATSAYNGKWKKTESQSSGKRMLANVWARRKAGLPHDNPFPAPLTLGFEPSCACNAGDAVPCVVLDPFGGSGRSGCVAKSLGRSFILIELKEEYVKMARAELDATFQQLRMFS